MSYFLASLVGAALLILARGIQRRLDAAYVLALALLAAGSAFSLVKGLDYKEAIVLAATFAALLPCRRQFYPEGIPARRAVHVGLDRSHRRRARRIGLARRLRPRARGVFGRAVVAGRASMPKRRARCGRPSARWALPSCSPGWRLFRPARPRPGAAEHRGHRAGAADRRAIGVDPCEPGFSAGTRRSCFSESGRRLHDVRPPGPELDRDGRSRSAPEGRRASSCGSSTGSASASVAWPVFFEVRPERLDTYLDLGLTLTKARRGSSHRPHPLRARAPLPQGPETRGIQAGSARGYHFEYPPREAVPSALPALARVSDAWLADKATREKGFSNASF